MLPMPCAHFADSAEPSHCGRSQCPAGRAEAAGFAEAGGKVGKVKNGKKRSIGKNTEKMLTVQPSIPVTLR